MIKIPIPPKLKRITVPSFEHRELVLGCLGIVLLIFFFVRVWFIPTAREMKKLKSEIAQSRGRLQEFSGPGGRSLDEALVTLQAAIAETEGNLTQKDKASEVLNFFLTEANHLGIDVLSVRPEPAMLYPTRENPFRLGNKRCQALPFQMHLRGRYETLGRYLELLREESPFTFTVDGLDIQKETGDSSVLRIDLFLTAYLFGIPS